MAEMQDRKPVCCCDSCDHFSVCAYKEDFLRIKATSDELSLSINSANKDLPIKVGNALFCKFYSTDFSRRHR